MWLQGACPCLGGSDSSDIVSSGHETSAKEVPGAVGEGELRGRVTPPCSGLVAVRWLLKAGEPWHWSAQWGEGGLRLVARDGEGTGSCLVAWL